MRFVYIMDPMERLLPDRDTTFAFQRSAQRRGHIALHAELRDIAVQGGEVWARARIVTVSDAAPSFSLGPPEDVNLATVDAILIRKDPPFDSDYLYVTLMLEGLRGQTLIVNDPRGLRDANEKLYALHFGRHMPRTIVASDRERIHRFLSEVGAGVMKPLDGAGGSGVLVVAAGDRNARSIVDMLTGDGNHPAMVQEYLPEVRRGDKRVLVLAGRVLGAINRVPREDDVRSNIHVGGRVDPCDVSADERAIVADMAPRLEADGLAFVGLDFIGGRLTEVNVTSPTGIQELSAHLGRDVGGEVIDWIERRALAFAAIHANAASR
jgi:glutathione synthase